MNFNYDNRKFKSIANSAGGEVGEETVFITIRMATWFGQNTAEATSFLET